MILKTDFLNSNFFQCTFEVYSAHALTGLRLRGTIMLLSICFGLDSFLHHSVVCSFLHLFWFKLISLSKSFSHYSLMKLALFIRPFSFSKIWVLTFSFRAEKQWEIGSNILGSLKTHLKFNKIVTEIPFWMQLNLSEFLTLDWVSSKTPQKPSGTLSVMKSNGNFLLLVFVLVI